MKTINTKLLTSMALLSGLLMSQAAFAATPVVSKECKQLQKHMKKSNYAKKAYQNKCVGKKATLKIPKLRINHKSKKQLEKERLEREVKLKAARAKAKKSQRKNSIKSKQSRSKGSFFKSAPRSRFYIGASIGQSTLNPEITGGGVSLTDTSDSGYKVNAGFQIKPRIAVEGFYADIGDAGIKTPSVANGKISYKLYGLSGIYSQPFGRRFKGLARLGLSTVDNTVSKGLIHKQVKNSNIFVGVGLAFNILPKLSIKGEYEYFDKDIQLISTGLSWQF